MTVTTVETIDLVLTTGEAFMSSAGKKFVKGEVYSLPKEEANKLLAIKADYDIRFFKKYDGPSTKKSAPIDTTNQSVLPTPEEIAISRNEASAETYAEAKALDKADAIASATRGHGDEAIEAQMEQKTRISVVGPTSEGMGEIDTAAEAKPKSGRGRPSNAVAV